MKFFRSLLLGFLVVSLILMSKPVFVYAQQAARSVWCTKVGVTNDPNPCPSPGAGGPIFGTGSGGFVHYCQGDPKWDDKSACGLGQIGCGPTSLAMIFTKFGDVMTPADTYQVLSSQGQISCAAGSSLEAFLRSAWLTDPAHKYEVGPLLTSGTELQLTLAKKYIDEGWLIIGSSHFFPSYKNPGTTYDHIFVVEDVDVTNGTFDNRDPANCDYTTGAEVESRRIRPANGASGIIWAYAYPIRKV